MIEEHCELVLGKEVAIVIDGGSISLTVETAVGTVESSSTFSEGLIAQSENEIEARMFIANRAVSELKKNILTRAL